VRVLCTCIVVFLICLLSCVTDDVWLSLRQNKDIYYEGHPINKLLNGIILLIVKT